MFRLKSREDEARSILGSFFCSSAGTHKKCSALRRRKEPVEPREVPRRSAEPLLMDEPTTHLDIWAIEGLIMALRSLKARSSSSATTCISSAALAQKVIHINNGKLTTYTGDYDYYLQKTGAEENACGSGGG